MIKGAPVDSNNLKKEMLRDGLSFSATQKGTKKSKGNKFGQFKLNLERIQSRKTEGSLPKVCQNTRNMQMKI